MKKTVLCILSLLMIISCYGCQKVEPVPPNPTKPQVDNAELDFNNTAISLFKYLEKNKNTVFSPLSLTLALALVANGADGETKQEFEAFYGGTIDQLNRDCLYRISRLTNQQGSTKLHIANSGWFDQRISINDDYKELIKNYYDAELFQGQLSSEEIKNQVNEWVSEKTNKMIEKLLSQNLPESTAALIINTLYFKGAWDIPFTNNDPEPGTFTLLDGSEIELDYLWNKDYYGYFEDDGCEGILLQYDDGKTVMIGILPKVDINEFIENLSAAQLKTLLENRGMPEIRVSIPAFEMSYTQEFTDILKNAGLSGAFDNADFSNMSEDDIAISEVLQKVKIIVDGEGTEAAAVTEVIMKDAAFMPTEYKVLCFDRPFVYMIYDLETDTILFMGTEVNPLIKE